MLVYAQVPRFYAEIERVRHPEWSDRPIIVGGDPRKKGLVQAATQEALDAGVLPGLPVLEALERCPRARTVRTDMRRYREVSTRLRAQFRSTAQRVELAGLDSAYLAPGSEANASVLAEGLLQRVDAEFRLPLRIGIAPIKFVARLAAEEAEDGTALRVDADDLAAFLHPLPVSRLPGVGPRTADRLAALQVHTVGDVARRPAEELIERFGNHGHAIHRAALGLGDATIRAAPHARSVSQELTLEAPELDRSQLAERLAELSRRVAQGLALERLDTRRLALKVRYLEGDTVTRTRTLDRALSEAPELLRVAEELLERTAAGHRAVRLIGLAATDLSRGRADDRQLDLFP